MRTFLLWRSPYGRPGALSRHPSVAAASEKKSCPTKRVLMQPIPHPATLCAASLPLTRHPANSLHTRTNVLGRSRHSFCAIFATLAHTFIVKRTSVTLLLRSQPEEWPTSSAGNTRGDFYLYLPYLGFSITDVMVVLAVSPDCLVHCCYPNADASFQAVCEF